MRNRDEAQQTKERHETRAKDKKKQEQNKVKQELKANGRRRWGKFPCLWNDQVI